MPRYTYLHIQDLHIARPRRRRAYPAMRSAFGATCRPRDSYHQSMVVIPSTTQSLLRWSSEDDKALRQLKASNVSWKRISTVLDGRPVAELKERWLDIRNGRHRTNIAYELDNLDENDGDEWYFEEDYDGDYGRESSHVSFSPSLNEDVSKRQLSVHVRQEAAIDVNRLTTRIMSLLSDRDRRESIISTMSSPSTKYFFSIELQQIGNGTGWKQSVAGLIGKPAATSPGDKQGPFSMTRVVIGGSIKSSH
ncbi:hypothetical protein BDW74DRAFT_152420 [Aspergillus multicolor]|uniref:SANT/Myb-like DNA-binding domain-containing protein n=1 Tax=Aspergillus multicolor TaxID=41759 RepID=UPI003CCDBA9C